MAEWEANNTWAHAPADDTAQWGETGAYWGESAPQSWGNANWETPEENKQQTQQSLTQDSSAAVPSNQAQLQPIEAPHSTLQPSAPSSIFLANTTIPQVNTIYTNTSLQKNELFASSASAQNQPYQLTVDVSEPHADQSEAALSQAHESPQTLQMPQYPQTAKAESRSAAVDFWDEPMQISPQMLDYQAQLQAPATATAVTAASKQISDDFFDFTSTKQSIATAVQQTTKEPLSATQPQPQLYPRQQQTHSRTHSDYSTVSSQVSVQSAATTQQLAKTSLKTRPKAPADADANAQPKALSKAEQRKLEKTYKESAKRKEEMEKIMLYYAAQKAAGQKLTSLPPKQPAQRPSTQMETKAEPQTGTKTGEQPSTLLQPAPYRDEKQFEALVRENERLRTEIRCFAFDTQQTFEDSAIRELQERFLQWRAENSESDALRAANSALSEKVARLERRDYESSQSAALYYQQQAGQLQKEVLDREEEKMRAVEQNNVALRKKNQQIQELIAEVARLRLELANK